MGLIGSQNTLMGVVFVTCLLLFLSFDIVNYFAGLTPSLTRIQAHFSNLLEQTAVTH